MVGVVLLLFGTASAGPLASGERVIVEIGGMDCAGCQVHVNKALDELPFLTATKTSFSGGQACAEVTGVGDTNRIHGAITSLGYTVEKTTIVQECPDKAKVHPRNDPWGAPHDLDASVISRGDEVDPRDHLASDKFTIIDFGAPWCGPCITTAATLKAYLADHPDTAVRAISLDAKDASASFALPAAKQHLRYVAGIPYFLVYDQKGKTLYKGGKVQEAIAMIDKKRERK